MTEASAPRRLVGGMIRAAILATLLVVLLATLLVALLAAAVLGADASIVPSLDAGTSGGLIEGGDPRSEGTGPGLVGAPLLILLGVVALGLATVVVTVVLVRVTRRS